MSKSNSVQKVFASNHSVEYTSFQSLEDTSKLYAITKRTIDIIGAIIGLVLTSPLFLLLASSIYSVTRKDQFSSNKFV